MDYILFARWFGLVSVILSLGILFNLEDAKIMAKNMDRYESGYIMGGVLPVIFGSLSLLYVDAFTFSWSTVVALVGVTTLILGVYRVIFVKHWKATIARHIEQIPFLFSLFGLMLGVVLLYIGFISKMFE